MLDTERQFEEYEKGLNAMDEFLESDDNSSVTSDGSELSDTIRSRTKEFIENSTDGCELNPNVYLSVTKMLTLGITFEC